MAKKRTRTTSIDFDDSANYYNVIVLTEDDDNSKKRVRIELSRDWQLIELAKAVRKAVNQRTTALRETIANLEAACTHDNK